MGIFADIIDRPLPKQASNVVASFPAVPIAIAGRNILDPNQTLIFYWVLGSVMLSAIFAFFSYYVPKPIRLRTTILSFLLWLLLFYGFTHAGIEFKDKIGYGLGVIIAIIMLLLLVSYFYFKSIFKEISQSETDEQNYLEKELVIKCLLYFVIILCFVSIIAIPMTLFLSSPATDKVLLTTSSIQFIIFWFWFVVSSLVAIYQQRGQ